MSIESWKSEYMPVSAVDVAPEDSLAHSLKKWEGLLVPNVAKHGLRIGNGILCDDALDARMGISGSDCALCVNFKYCDGCPLLAVRGDVRCDQVMDGEKISPWAAWVKNDDAVPMLKWLKKAAIRARASSDA